MSNFVNLFDIIYPIGSVYITFNETFSTDLIGGTWELLENTFLYSSANDTGLTGGETTHTLTVNEMPNHYHKLWVSAWASAFGGASVTYSNKDSNYLSDNGKQGNFTGGGASTQQLSALHNLLHLVQNSLNYLKGIYIYYRFPRFFMGKFLKSNINYFHII